jgi:hypothetical protein
VVPAAVADQVEQPAEASGPGAALVVVEHVDGVGAVAQLAEQRLEVAPGRQQAGRRWLAELGAFGIDEARAGDVPLGIAGGVAQVDQNQLRRAQAAGQRAGLDHQWQVGKGGHGVLRWKGKRGVY